jgi:putative ubiquitin-RnfH superfamily antitoxin RatB of RatAB toxin-antitoxin module
VTDAAAAVTIVYALPEKQYVVEIDYSPELTAVGALTRSGLSEKHPEIVSGELVLGVWGVRVNPDCVLNPGDRVEISRPLVADPRDMRRDLLLHGRVMGGAAAPEAKLRTKD